MSDDTQPGNENAKLMKRRNFLKVIGGGAILAAGTGGAFVATRTPHKAIEPWKLALGTGPEVDARRMILSHAILAPNPHNRQPWMVDMVGEDEMVLYCDPDRRLPHTDPFDRQITIGLGCFLELAELAAKSAGIGLDINLFPEGEAFPRLDDRAVARLKLTNSGGSADSLFAQIFDRRSNKDPYDVSRSVSSGDAAELISVAGDDVDSGSITDPNKASRLREIAWNAMETELRTYRTAKESIDLLRIGKAEIEANPDGIDLGGPFFDTINALGLLDRQEMLDTESSAFQQQVDAIKEPFQTANGFVFVKTTGNTRVDQIAAGRAYVRINLKATEMGVAMQPWSQSLQEFPEVEPQFQAIREVLGVAQNETLQMFARIGYGEKPAPSPRWRYETRIRNG